MKICIRRGSNQIGGSCIEVESQGKRLVLDIGQPLNSRNAESVEMPDVNGFEKADQTLLGIVLSHPHLDHYGLAFRVQSSTTFLMGEATECILKAAAVFTPSGGTFETVINLADRKPIVLGPFRITPYDSYAVLIEGDGQRVFYTGDLRAHGRKAALFEKLIALPPEAVNVLLMEGTTISRSGTESGFPSETDLENQLVNIFKETAGMPLLWCSGQNIDRLVTAFRACKRSGRKFIIDMYTAHILAATGNPHLPQAHWPEVRVFLPKFQKQRIKRQSDYAVADLYKPYRIYPEHLTEAANNSVMLFRPSMQIDVESAGCLDGACLVYSMWDGYLNEDKMKPFLAWLDGHGIPMHKCHTSGHAAVKDLQKLRDSFPEAIVVPIHTNSPERFKDLFGKVEIHKDGEWWQVYSN
jgi:ribonuclease J